MKVPHQRSRLARAIFFAALMAVHAAPVAAEYEKAPPLDSAGGQFVFLQPLRQPPLTPFRTLAGQAVDLSIFRGKVVLLNFWATWCAPCVREMPSLDRLQALLGGKDFTVAAISIDRGGAPAVEPFLARLGLQRLPIYVDPDNRTGFLTYAGGKGGAFPLYALPISYLIDRQGRAVGYFPGAAEWTSRDALRFIRYFIDSR